MTPEIIIVLSILGLALLLFITGWLRMDVVALMVMASLAILGIVSPTEALAGFSNPAVVTVWAMFILSAGLYQTGIARIIGRQVLRLSGTGEARLVALIVLVSGILSAFMNNIGVAALMLPVVMDLARTKQIPPSRLLIPLAYGTMLGGLTTLIGTPPNLIISYALENSGETGFRLFDYSPIGGAALVAGLVFLALAGRHLLPRHGGLGENKGRYGTAGHGPENYALQERSFVLEVVSGCSLAGKTLSESRLRAGLGLNVVAIARGDGHILDPHANTRILAGDRLHIQGKPETLKVIQQWEITSPDALGMAPESLLKAGLQVFEATLPARSDLHGKRLQETAFRKRLGINVVSVRKKGSLERSSLHDLILESGDILLLQAPVEKLQMLESEGKITDLRPAEPELLLNTYRLHELLLVIRIGGDAGLFARSIAESQIGSAFGITVLGTMSEQLVFSPFLPAEGFSEGQTVLAKANADDLQLFQTIKELRLVEEGLPPGGMLESEEVQMAEVALAPRSMLAGKTLREISFRQKYGLTVLAIWSEGVVHRTNLQTTPLHFGDALLLYGKRERLELLDTEPDFLLLTELSPRPKQTGKAVIAGMIMLAVLLPVLTGLLSLDIAAVTGVVLMVLTGCLKMEEAYRSIDWRAVFLIAGMLSLGTALQKTGAAGMMAEGVVIAFGRFGIWGIIGGLYLLTAVLTIAIHPAALVVIMSPVALEAASVYGISPQAMMMAVAISASAVFMSPVSHPANLLMMGPGGYRFSDYLKAGVPLTLIVMAVTLLLLPLVWPL